MNKSKHGIYNKRRTEQPDLKAVKRSLLKEIERTKPKGFWQWLRHVVIPTRAERKLTEFYRLYPNEK